MTGHEDKTDAELVAYCRDVLKNMKANGYSGIVWDELLARFSASSEKRAHTADPSSTLKMARVWVDMLEGPHVIIPAPVISRSQILDMAREYMATVEQAELWQRRCEWLRDNAIFDNSWIKLDMDGFLKRLDEQIAEELK
jgi:hypothetical protein